MIRLSLGYLGQLPSTAVRRSVQARKSSSGLTSFGAGGPLCQGFTVTACITLGSESE